MGDVIIMGIAQLQRTRAEYSQHLFSPIRNRDEILYQHGKQRKKKLPGMNLVQSFKIENCIFEIN